MIEKFPRTQRHDRIASKISAAATIEGGGQIAGVLVSDTNAIIINAPNDALVTLRNLDINGLGTGLIGIKILAAKSVVVDNCHIYGFRTAGGTNGRGISDERTNASPIPTLWVTNCDIRNNIGGVAASGVNGGPIRVVIDNTRIQGQTSIGVFGSNNAVISVRSSQVTGNLSDAVHVGEMLRRP